MTWAQGVEYAAEAAGRPGTVLASRRRRCGDRRDATAALLAAFPGRRRSIPRAQGRVGRSTGSRGRLGPHRPIKPATSLAQASISPFVPTPEADWTRSRALLPAAAAAASLRVVAASPSPAMKVFLSHTHPSLVPDSARNCICSEFQIVLTRESL